MCEGEDECEDEREDECKSECGHVCASVRINGIMSARKSEMRRERMSASAWVRISKRENECKCVDECEVECEDKYVHHYKVLCTSGPAFRHYFCRSKMLNGHMSDKNQLFNLFFPCRGH